MSVLSQVSHEMCFKYLAWKYSHMYVHAYTHTNDAFDPCERKLRVSSQKEFRNQTGRQKSKVGIYLNKSMLSKGASLVVQRVKRLPAMQETWV